MEFNNCIISIGKVYEDGAIDQSTGAQYVGAEKQKAIPQVSQLTTDQAMEYWHRLQSAGYVDEQLQPADGKSWAVMSLLAYVMADLLNLPSRWEPFEQLWQHSNLGNNYQGLYNTNKRAVEIEHELRSLLTA